MINRQALEWMRGASADAVEVYALRFDELEPLVQDLGGLGLGGYDTSPSTRRVGSNRSKRKALLRRPAPKRG